MEELLNLEAYHAQAEENRAAIGAAGSLMQIYNTDDSPQAFNSLLDLTGDTEGREFFEQNVWGNRVQLNGYDE
jgi:hypothetical protein